VTTKAPYLLSSLPSPFSRFYMHGGFSTRRRFSLDYNTIGTLTIQGTNFPFTQSLFLTLRPLTSNIGMPPHALHFHSIDTILGAKHCRPPHPFCISKVTPKSILFPFSSTPIASLLLSAPFFVPTLQMT